MPYVQRLLSQHRPSRALKLQNTQSVMCLLTSDKRAIHLFVCRCCIFQKLCIFDSFGTLVFAVFMGVWGKLLSLFSRFDGVGTILCKLLKLPTFRTMSWLRASICLCHQILLCEKSTSKAVASSAPLVSHFLISLDSLSHTWPGSTGLCGKPLAPLERGDLTARSLAWSEGFMWFLTLKWSRLGLFMGLQSYKRKQRNTMFRQL